MILFKIFIIGGLFAILLAFFFPIILLNIIRSMLGMGGQPKSDPFQQHTDPFQQRTQQSNKKETNKKQNKIFSKEEGEYVDFTEIK